MSDQPEWSGRKITAVGQEATSGTFALVFVRTALSQAAHDGMGADDPNRVHFLESIEHITRAIDALSKVTV